MGYGLDFGLHEQQGGVNPTGRQSNMLDIARRGGCNKYEKDRESLETHNML